MEKYQKTEKLGEGTYGTVYKAKVRGKSDVVAMKKIKVTLICSLQNCGG